MFSLVVKEKPRTKKTTRGGVMTPMMMRRRWRDSFTTFLIAKMRKMPSTPDQSKSCFEPGVLCTWSDPKEHPSKVCKRSAKLTKNIWAGDLNRNLCEEEPAELSQGKPSISESLHYTSLNLEKVEGRHLKSLSTLLICCIVVSLLCVFLLQWFNPSDMKRQMTDRARHTYGKGKSWKNWNNWSKYLWENIRGGCCRQSIALTGPVHEQVKAGKTRGKVL